MITCPNVNLDSWKDLVGARGETEAYYLWDLYNGDVPSSEYQIQPLAMGVDLSTQENKEASVLALNTISEFLDKVGIEQRLVPRILGSDGSVIEGAKAMANVMFASVDILDDLESRPEAWNSLPKEAARWWFKLLKNDTQLRNQLFLKFEGKEGQDFEDTVAERIGDTIIRKIGRAHV